METTKKFPIEGLCALIGLLFIIIPFSYGLAGVLSLIITTICLGVIIYAEFRYEATKKEERAVLLFAFLFAMKVVFFIADKHSI